MFYHYCPNLLLFTLIKSIIDLNEHPFTRSVQKYTAISLLAVCVSNLTIKLKNFSYY